VATTRELSYDEALAALQQLEERDKMTPFAVGDIVRGAVAALGGRTTETCKRLAGDLGRSLSWVAQREMVAAAFPLELREELWGGEEPPPPVTWVHHRIVVYRCKTPEEMQRWIRIAIDQQLSTRQLEEALAGVKPDSGDDIVITVPAPGTPVLGRVRLPAPLRVGADIVTLLLAERQSHR